MNANVRKKPLAGAIALIALIAGSSAGCASHAESARAPENALLQVSHGARRAADTFPPAPGLSAAGRKLTFLFSAPAGRRTLHAFQILRERLQRAGYRLVLDEAAPHEASIELRWAENGDSAALEMNLLRGTELLETIVDPLPADETAARAAFEDLVARLTLSPGLVSLTT